MVGILIRMKVSALRHSMNPQRASQMISGLSLGLLAAAGTIWLATFPFSHESSSIDVLAAAFALWSLGWIMGPIFFGGGDQPLRPANFALLPVPSRRLAMGLFCAAFVGVGAFVTLVAFTSLVVYGARFGVGPLIVAIPAALLQLALIVLLSRIMAEVLTESMRSQRGAILGALVSAAIIALVGSGWALAPTISQALTHGFPPALSVIVRALPSSWGLIAVAAASRSSWLVAIVMISAQAALIGVLLVIWSRQLERRMTTRQTAHLSKVRNEVRARHLPVPITAVGAVISKELRSWLRDPMRMYYLYFAFFYALLFCLLPLAVGTRIFLPWVAATFILVAAMNANFYGSDASALWLILLTPGAERCDVRGRQVTWELLVAPVAVVLTIALTAVSGQVWAWPWTLALTPALLGGAAGLMVLISVYYPAPRTAQLGRSNATLQAGSDIGQAILLLILVPITAAPALAIVSVGAKWHNSGLQWSGVGVGIITGSFFSWWLGRIAYRRLQSRGPELLHLMRSGSSARFGSSGASGFLAGLSTGKRQVVILCLSMCWIPLVPQGIVPMVMKLSGTRVLSWFLALYLPEPYQWPTIFAMIAIGCGLLGTGILIMQRAKKAQQRNTAL